MPTCALVPSLANQLYFDEETAVAGSHSKGLASRKFVEPHAYQSDESVHQYESHVLSGSLLSSLQVQTPSARLQQIKLLYRSVTAKAQANAMIAGLLTRHAPCHASLLQHHDVDVDSPRATKKMLSEKASRFRPACFLGSMFTRSLNRAFNLSCDFGTLPLLSSLLGILI